MVSFSNEKFYLDISEEKGFRFAKQASYVQDFPVSLEGNDNSNVSVTLLRDIIPYETNIQDGGTIFFDIDKFLNEEISKYDEITRDQEDEQKGSQDLDVLSFVPGPSTGSSFVNHAPQFQNSEIVSVNGDGNPDELNICSGNTVNCETRHENDPEIFYLDKFCHEELSRHEATIFADEEANNEFQGFDLCYSIAESSIGHSSERQENQVQNFGIDTMKGDCNTNELFFFPTNYATNIHDECIPEICDLDQFCNVEVNKHEAMVLRDKEAKKEFQDLNLSPSVAGSSVELPIYFLQDKISSVDQNRSSNQGLQSKKSFSCEICSKCFSTTATLKKHQLIHSAKNPDRCQMCPNTFKCKDCPKSFSSNSHLKIHERTHTREKPLQCQDCSKLFSSSSKLKIHQMIHTLEKPFRCSHCPISFKSHHYLKKHERSHVGGNRSESGSESFFTSSYPKAQQRTHTKGNTFKCQVCPKSFSSTSHLKIHERTHTGEKPFQCQECSKLFSSICNLKAHERTHSGEKPFECKGCSKSFSSSSNLKIHERIHTGEKPFECQDCSKSFSSSSNLRIHERTHTGEKPFKCQDCSKPFSLSCNLKKHERNCWRKPVRVRRLYRIIS